jgi:gluconate 2-dehydrogenase subunit 3-like protein
MAEAPKLRVLNDGPSSSHRMNRREMVRRVLGGVGTGFALPAVAASHPIHKHLADVAALAEADAKVAASDWAPEFLDPHQNESLTVLAERIVPGSTKAQVNRFIDLLLSVDTQENQQKFNNSLAAFEGESLKRYGHPFTALTEAQQNELLTVASTEKPGREPGKGDWSWFDVPSKEGSEPPRVTLRDHFENLKGWVSGAYYSSEVGMRELGWTGDYFFDSFPGCQHPEGHH